MTGQKVTFHANRVRHKHVELQDQGIIQAADTSLSEDFLQPIVCLLDKILLAEQNQ